MVEVENRPIAATATIVAAPTPIPTSTARMPESTTDLTGTRRSYASFTSVPTGRDEWFLHSYDITIIETNVNGQPMITVGMMIYILDMTNGQVLFMSDPGESGPQIVQAQQSLRPNHIAWEFTSIIHDEITDQDFEVLVQVTFAVDTSQGQSGAFGTVLFTPEPFGFIPTTMFSSQMRVEYLP